VTITGRAQRRRADRKRSDPSVVRVRLKDQEGNARWATAYLSDITEGGVGLSLMTPLEIGSMVVIRGNFGEDRTDVQLQADVKWCGERPGGVYQAGLDFTANRPASGRDDPQQTSSGDSRQFSDDPEQLDCYEVMQLNTKADADTIHRVHRILAQRYHPDTPDTGNAEMFIQVTAAARILSDPERRAKYDANYRAAKQLQWKIFDQAEASVGPRAEKAKRRGILGLLYAKATHNPEHASMTAVEFEEILGCPRERLQGALWYLKGKGYITRADNGRYGITVRGFDEVEMHSLLPPNSDLKLLEQATAREA
jgi:curved DNA-binding protein